MKNDNLLAGLAAGEPSACQWAMDAALRVLDSGGAIGFERAAGLATTPERRRRALRDMHLAQAGGLVGGTPLTLHRAVEDFRRSCWPIWQRRHRAPESAAPVEISLYRAFRAGSVPTTPQGLGKILREYGFRNRNSDAGFPMA